MSKRLIITLALAFVLGLSFAAYAEVQNVKVSGDITAAGVLRDNFDFTKTPTMGSGHVNANYDDFEKDLFTITRVRVDADLTDNVTATVRLLNERNWNGDNVEGLAENNRNIGLATANGANKESQIDIDLAFVTLKEFLYSPLTLRVGRQELHFNNDWIIGDPDTNGIALKSALAEGDLSARKSFDAIRATLNYDPLIADVIFAKLAENSTVVNDDTNLYGLNLNYRVDNNTTLEGFFYSKIKGSQAAAVTNVDSGNATSFNPPDTKNKSDQVHTVGARVINRSLKNLTVDVQGAFQFGTYNPKFDPNARYVNANDKAETANRRAWGIEALATYDLKDVNSLAKYAPSITGAYVFLSGNDRDKVGDDDYTGWDSMFENQTFGHIINATMGFTNCHLVGLSLKAKPFEDVTAKLDAIGLWTVKRYPDGRRMILSGVSGARQFRMAKNPFLGQEYDLTLTYDYTEDVQFSLLGGVFLPSKAINGNIDNSDNLRAVASELIGSMKVTF